MKKKILSVIVCAAAILSLTACGNNEDPLAGLGNVSTPSSAAASKPASTKPAQSSSAPEQSSAPESKPEESSVPEDTNKIDWDSVPYADELDFEVADVDGGVSIMRYLGSDTVVKIPETINGKKVLAVSKFQWRDGSWQSLDPSDGFVDSVFHKATHVKLPDSVSNIAYAFYGCTSLVSANIPSSVTTLSVEAFSGCTSLSSIEIPNTVTEIGASAFAYSGLESLTVPDSVKVFDGWMITHCSNLKEISLPKNIRAADDVIDLGREGKRTISLINLSGCSSLTNTDFLKNVKSFADDNSAPLAVDFGYCHSLTSITFPDGIQQVGGFNECNNLTEITIPNSVTNFTLLEYGEFHDGGLDLYGCENLKKITLSDNLEYLYEIKNCPQAAEIVYNGKTYKSNQLPNLYKAVNGN